MDNENTPPVISEELKKRFQELPRAVQNALTSADIEKNLRTLSESHKLHLDQWEKLENEVLLVLLGFQPAEKLQENIRTVVGVTDEIAAQLANDISGVVFEPVRRALEDETGPEEEGPDAPAAAEVPQTAHTPAPVPAVAPATPPPLQPEGTAQRRPISTSYAARAPSQARPSTEGDPYREQLQ